MSDQAPERIWAWPTFYTVEGETPTQLNWVPQYAMTELLQSGQAFPAPQRTPHSVEYARLDTVYTRAQVEAMVAEERERIAYEIVELAEHDAEERNWKDGAKLCRRIAAAIRAQGEAV